MMKIIGYARVSSAEQANNSHALEQQQQRLKDAGVTEVWTDVLSGSRNTRPNYRKLMEAIEEGLVCEVVATRIDRIARSLPDLRAFADLCMKKSVNLRILDQQLDLSTPHGKMMFNMLGSMAEWELDMLKSRVNAGLKHFRQEGRVHGVIPFGYKRENDRYSANKSLYKDTDKTIWDVAREIIETFLEVGTVRGTAKIMGERYGQRANRRGGAGFEDFPREYGLRYWLQSPVLRGHTAYYYRTRDKEVEIVPDRQHERLITEVEAVEIERLLGFSRKGEREFAEPMPLAGLIYCGICDRKARAFKYPKKDRTVVRWYCYGKYEAPSNCPKAKGIRNELAVAAAIDALVERGQDIANLADYATSSVVETPEVQQLRDSLRALEAIHESAPIKEAKHKIVAQIALLNAQQKELTATNEILRSELAEIASDREFWEWLDDRSKKRLFRRFIEKIISLDGSIVEVRLRV